VRKLLICLLGSFATACTLAAADNLVIGTSNPPPAAEAGTNNAVDQEYKKLLETDDTAQAEADQWIRQNQEAAVKGFGLSSTELQRRIRDRFAPVRTAYEEFIRRHPDHAKAHLAFGSFLNDLHDEEGAQEQWEKALALNSKDPAAYNNLANLYTHAGPIKKAFEYYGKAIELNSQEPLYYRNLGDVVYLFRKDAGEFYSLTEQQVFDKALELYRKALKLVPNDFPLASDLAQTYYGIKPLRLDEALQAWTNTLAIAHDEVEREGVYIHFARLKLQADRFAEVHAHLNAVTNEMYAELKRRVARNLDERERKAEGTNAPPATPEKKP
jgi:tetratricopeptide (TPR) repeat protein